MKQDFLRIVSLTAAVCLVCTGCTGWTGISSAAPALLPAQTDSAEQSCLEFVQRHMTGDGVYTSLLEEENLEDLATGREVLSESQGLMLRYYADLSNREEYAASVSFLKDRLDTGAILSYRVKPDGFRFPVNAAVDDLRILRGLLEGAEAFSEPEYASLCGIYADRLYKTNVKDGLLLDFYDETYGTAGNLCTLCYSDFKTMELLGAKDRRWLTVEENMLGVVLAGYLDDDFPFFRTRYLPEEDIYSEGNLRTVEFLLTALHLSEIGRCPETTTRWLKDALAAGAVYGEYTQAGEATTEIQSTAIYALCVLLGVSEGEPELVRAAMERLLSFQITDPASTLYGAFADERSGQAYSFDNLMALTAMRAQAEYLAEGEGGK